MVTVNDHGTKLDTVAAAGMPGPSGPLVGMVTANGVPAVKAAQGAPAVWPSQLTATTR